MGFCENVGQLNLLGALFVVSRLLLHLQCGHSKLLGLRTRFEDQYFRRNNFICWLAVRMKLFLHNILTSRVLKSVKVGYPLKLKANTLKVSTVDYDPASVARLIPKVEWSVVKSVADEIGEEYIPCLPEEVPVNYSENEEFLKLAHRALLEVDVMEGVLVCPETGREFTISNGIPNMLVNEGE
ncbi:hypothetical protein MS3_00005062 [Schistosoma haematobium]|uniref:Multifunctional methyltransferase subunit TRM112-like protein n=4 Tax=Schistosoma TaxID=6181 RepID=A0A922ITV9_SCHHA|nr:hypothetical protein MS3_00005062 [Schistosoma haematobium]KAH9587258.1 hypothetical protein MS3_00005062 [Schistosoma haematobium]